jgi:hypothetical protein
MPKTEYILLMFLEWLGMTGMGEYLYPFRPACLNEMEAGQRS